jgi:hypothetical protein
MPYRHSAIIRQDLVDAHFSGVIVLEGATRSKPDRMTAKTIAWKKFR